MAAEQGKLFGMAAEQYKQVTLAFFSCEGDVTQGQSCLTVPIPAGAAGTVASNHGSLQVKNLADSRMERRRGGVTHDAMASMCNRHPCAPRSKPLLGPLANPRLAPTGPRWCLDDLPLQISMWPQSTLSRAALQPPTRRGGPGIKRCGYAEGP